MMLAPNPEFFAEADDVVQFKIVDSEEELHSGSDDGIFRPLFTHQVFGENEQGEINKIFGYRDLKVKVNVSPGRLNTHISIESTSQFQGVVKPDNVIAKIADWLPKDAAGAPAYTQSVDEFARKLEDEASFVPIGELVKKDVLDGNTSVETYLYDGATPGAVEYHDRLQFFLVWYIDGARFIGLDDLKWKVFTTFKREEVAGRAKYSFTGMLTMYEYYAWRTDGKERGAAVNFSEVFNEPFVDNIRPRISQVFVMPPHQRKGHGRRLLQAAYDYCIAKKSVVVDIAVEEPSEGMVRLRDVVDVQNAIAQIADPATFFSQPYTVAAGKTLTDVLLLGKEQARRVYEIAQLHFLDIADETKMKAFRLSIKTKLIQPVVREKKQEEKMIKNMVEEELKTHNETQKAFRDRLHQDFEQLVQDYRSVLECIRV